MAKESTYSTITPVLTDYIRAINDPGGTPATANIEITDLHTLLKTSNDALYYGVKDIAYVSSNFSKTSNTTLADVTGLSFTLASGGVYKFVADLYVTAAGAGGVKVAMSGAATATSIQYFTNIWMTDAITRTLSSALDTAVGVTDNAVYISIIGSIIVNAGGTFTLKFAQNASNGTPSTIYAGSTFEVQKIA